MNVTFTWAMPNMKMLSGRVKNIQKPEFLDVKM